MPQSRIDPSQKNLPLSLQIFRPSLKGRVGEHIAHRIGDRCAEIQL